MSILIRDLRDFAAAKLYCTRTGDIVSLPTLDQLNLTDQEQLHLAPWIAYFTSWSRRKDAMLRNEGTDKLGLVSKLLRVYLENE